MDRAGQIRKRLLVQSDVETKLTQQSSRLRAAEEVLRENLQREQIDRETKRKKIKELEIKLKDCHADNDEKTRHLEAGKKSISLLNMKIRDLQRAMTENSNSEHRVSEEFLECNRKVRELERELFDLNMENERMRDDEETKAERSQKLFQDSEKMKDEKLRESQRAEVQRIAVQHDMKNLTLEKQPLDMKYSDVMQEYRDTQNEIKTQQEVHEQRKIELEKRVQDEENANNGLVNDIAAKAKIESELAADLAEETSAKEVLIRQIEDKDSICVELGKRIHKVENTFQELSMDLKRLDSETVEKMQLKEELGSQIKILGSKLEAEQENVRKITQWSQMERMEAEELDRKFSQLKRNETAHALALKQDEAWTARTKERLEEINVEIKKIKEELHNTLAEKDFKHEKLEETNEDLQHMNARFSKLASEVESFHRELNERTSSHHTTTTKYSSTRTFLTYTEYRHTYLREQAQTVHVGKERS